MRFSASRCLASFTFVSGLSGSFGALLLVLIVASLVGTLIGLLHISALAYDGGCHRFSACDSVAVLSCLGGGIKPVHEMPVTAQWIASVTPTRWAYEADLLKEASGRKASFTNDLEQKLLDCQSSVARCQAPSPARQAQPPAGTAKTETDIAAASFPLSDGRSTYSHSLQILGIFIGVFVILILGTLSLKATQ